MSNMRSLVHCIYMSVRRRCIERDKAECQVYGGHRKRVKIDKVTFSNNGDIFGQDIISMERWDS